ncbi:MAG: glutathione S-transferase family protein [Pseudomonadota bacterium]
MLEVWGRKSSSNVQALMWAIDELGLAHNRYDAGLMHGVNDTPEYLAMNPNGTVPTLRDGDGEPLFESAAIIRYLANKYGKSPFWPDELSSRTQIDMWAEWSKLNIALKFTAPIFWLVVRTAPSQRNPQAIRNGLDVFEKNLGIAEARLVRHEYLVGDAFTSADILFGHVLYRYFDIDIERKSLPAVRTYYDRLTERPAYQDNVMVSYEELRVSD